MNATSPSSPSRAGTIALVVSVIGAFLIVGVLVCAMRRYNQSPNLETARGQDRLKNFHAVRQTDLDALHTYSWEAGKGIGRVPLDQAMRLTLEEWKNPAAGRSNLIARVDKATALPPKAPEKPSEFE